MTIAAIRKRLIAFLADADEKKVKAIYTLLESDMEEASFVLSDTHKEILDKEHEQYIEGKSNAYTWTEAKKIIRSKKAS